MIGHFVSNLKFASEIYRSIQRTKHQIYSMKEYNDTLKKSLFISRIKRVFLFPLDKRKLFF